MDNNFSIILDDNSAEFLPGSKITGHVLVQKKGGDAVSGILVSLYGVAQTKWTETYTVSYTEREHGKDVTRHRTEYRHYNLSEQLLELNQMLFGDGGSKKLIASDEMKLSFSLQLPNNHLAISCNIQNEAWIYYVVTAVMKRPWLSSGDTITSLPVKILPAPLNLNTVPGADRPSQARIDKSFGSCCKTEPLTIICSTPKWALIVQEKFPVVVELVNRSGYDIKDLSAVLAQIWTYTSHCPGIGHHTREHFIPLQELMRGKRTPFNSAITTENDVWQFKMEVPNNIPPSFSEEACKIVKMKYAIMVCAFVNGGSFCCCGCCASEVPIMLPVLVGSTPVTKEPLEHSPAFVGLKGLA